MEQGAVEAQFFEAVVDLFGFIDRLAVDDACII